MAEKGGEPAALEELLAELDARGALVSLDAASCHPSAAGAIVARGADHFIPQRGGHATRLRSAPGCARAWTR